MTPQVSNRKRVRLIIGGLVAGLIILFAAYRLYILPTTGERYTQE